MTKYIIFFVFTTLPTLVFAQTMSMPQALDFGEAIVTNNNSTHSITVSPGGGVSADPEFIVLTNPQPAIVQITGGTPGQAITSVNVTVNTNPNASGQSFTIDNITTSYPSNLDGSGSAQVLVGARLNTSGTATHYNASTNFNGALDIEINF